MRKGKNQNPEGEKRAQRLHFILSKGCAAEEEEKRKPTPEANLSPTLTVIFLLGFFPMKQLEEKIRRHTERKKRRVFYLS